jgi:Sec-independent protein translocase protein TatA
MFGPGELIVIGFVLLVVFSASRMAQLGNALGKFVYSFRKAKKGDGFVDAKAKKIGQLKPSPEEDAQVVPGKSDHKSA